jgi:hypothetical protein
MHIASWNPNRTYLDEDIWKQTHGHGYGYYTGHGHPPTGGTSGHTGHAGNDGRDSIARRCHDDKMYRHNNPYLDGVCDSFYDTP